MIITTDYHMHSFCSVDSTASMKELCRNALEKGLDTVIFTEHKDFIIELEGCDFFDYDKYIEEINRCREEFSPSLTIKAGIEIDFSSDYKEDAVLFPAEYDFDLVIGSLHYLGIDPISEDRSVEFFKNTSKEKVLPFYWKELKACAETGRFDVIGHLDMIKRYSIPFYGPFDPEEWKEEITDILQLIIETDTALEINTSGLRHEPEEIYPCRRILEMYKELGGITVTVGSDAHLPEQVGHEFNKAEKLIKEFGFELLEI